MKEEPEVITFKEIVERNKNMKEEEMMKVVLECRNCGHKDLLKNFILEKKNSRNVQPYPKPNIQPEPYPDNPWKPYPNIPKPWKPYPYITKYRQNIKNLKSNKIMNIMLGNKEYEDMFYCKKCGSSLVVLCKEFIKNNILRGLDNG